MTDKTDIEKTAQAMIEAGNKMLNDAKSIKAPCNNAYCDGRDMRGPCSCWRCTPERV